tara:strand:+ start:1128 stop:1436 length:309 start_codon:yes stop_codon:yes gene_type:complete
MEGGKAKKFGTRREVWNGSAEMTTGKLTKKDLKLNKQGEIVSKKASANGKTAMKFLKDAGYTTKKGVFGAFKDGKPTEVAKAWTKKEDAKKKEAKKAKKVKK